MPKESYSAPQVGCLVRTCEKSAPSHFPICSYHWRELPEFILGYLEASHKVGESKWNHAVEWAAAYLDMEEESD
jgi:hypothetical protein